MLVLCFSTLVIKWVKEVDVVCMVFSVLLAFMKRGVAMGGVW
jgi:hypothetical protein